MNTRRAHRWIKDSCTRCGLRRRETWVVDPVGRSVLALVWTDTSGDRRIRPLPPFKGVEPPIQPLRPVAQAFPNLPIGPEPPCDRSAEAGRLLLATPHEAPHLGAQQQGDGVRTGRAARASPGCRGRRADTAASRRTYIVPPESMIDVTQRMACIQCGACVSDCLSMEVDPLFIGPAALAKAYRFVGDPRDGQHERAPQGPRRGPARHLRLHALLQLHRGLPQGRGADEPDHAAAPHRRLGPRDRRPQQRPPPREGVRRRTSSATACCTRPTCCPTPTAASSTRAPSPVLLSSLPVILRRSGAAR